jgi:hypothetical protein
VTGRVLRHLSTDLPAGLRIVFDGRMMVASGGSVLLAVFGFGLQPAVRAMRQRPLRPRTQRMFVGLQVGTSCVLLVLSSVLWRGNTRLSALEPQFDYRHVVVVDPQLAVRNDGPDRGRAVLDDMATCLGGMSGVTGVTMATEGATRQAGSMPAVLLYEVAPSYFDVLGLPVVRGRVLAAGEQHVMLVSESAARGLWPDRDALGQTLALERQAASTVVGIVKDSGTSKIGNRGLGEAYLPISDAHLTKVVLLVHTMTDSQTILRSARDVAARSGVTPTVRMLSPTWSLQGGSGAVLMGTLGAVATLLAFTGVFGLVALAVAQGTREIGIRMALGADASDVLGALAGQQLPPIVGGIVAGMLVAVAGAFVMRSQLYGLSPIDPASELLGVAGLSIVSVVAIVIPGRRALRVDPAVALRSE